MITWRFPSNNYGETKGINDSGVAMFRGTPLKSLAREICQNSLDAAQSKTVVVDFDLFYMPINEIPGIEELKDAFQRSLDFWKSMKGGSTREFFENAKKAVTMTRCPMLRISDHNTTGLLGSHEYINTDWVNLTKSAGASDKLGTAGGSFGIGKYAPFACSTFSTVYYSTYDIKHEKAFQGVSRLVTFEDANGETTQGTGYYGEEKNTPVYEQLHLQKDFTRAEDDFGTDIYVAGYKYDNGVWQTNIIASVLDSFLGAIWNEQLIVNVGGIKVSKNTLPAIIEEYRNNLIGNTADYYEVLTRSETKWKENDFPGLGKVRFGALLGNPDSPRKVAMVRKTGMKIKDKSGISSSVPFTGFLFIEGDVLNRKLRAMENPEHTEWQPERVVANPSAAKAVVTLLYKFLRETIQELAYTGEQQEVDAAGAGAYLPDEDPEAKQQANEEVVSNKVQNIEKKIKAAPKSKPQPEADGQSEVSEGEPSEKEGVGVQRKTGGEEVGWVDGEGGHVTNTGGDTKLTYTEESTSGTTSKVNKPVKKSILLQKFVPICINKDKGIYVLIVMAADDYTNVELELFLSAETREYEAPIISAEIPGGAKLKVKGNVVQEIKLSKEVPIRVKVVLEYSSLCSMEVQAYAIEK